MKLHSLIVISMFSGPFMVANTVNQWTYTIGWNVNDFVLWNGMLSAYCLSIPLGFYILCYKIIPNL